MNFCGSTQILHRKQNNENNIIYPNTFYIGGERMRKIRESAAKEQFLGTIILNNPMWVASHDSPDFDLGKEVFSGLSRGVMLDSNHGAILGDSGWTTVKLMKVEEVPGFIEEREKLVRSRLELRGQSSTSEEVVAREMRQKRQKRPQRMLGL